MFVKIIVFVNFFMHLLNGTLDGNIFIEMDGDCHFQETLYAVLFNQHFDKCLYICFRYSFSYLEQDATKKEPTEAVKKGKHYLKTTKAHKKGEFRIPSKKGSNMY